ncbi:hypothetical protein HanXRQr2_Chr01g0038791 [Helianthus annuus]|uniref:Uncharacterized protein n=1 Tax=Helianthus annuus TaxID=4232 RepID=A0A9K3JXD4_HELAN|nr:hypothetical protein HanXRQr2_Chr01g0038781 [Helianthus annuus]KAF5823482.1 hypothetical protein HanXRQr2_Chr01g0038791 [Helianthus annuus]KAJ0895111.1 hypothetical protein HanPSC8_Chr09g0396701 [Helianthus annuus]
MASLGSNTPMKHASARILAWVKLLLIVLFGKMGLFVSNQTCLLLDVELVVEVYVSCL